MKEKDLGDNIIGCAMKVHSALGPGLVESAYEVCLAHELTKADLEVRRQVALPVVYDDMRLDGGFRIDLLLGPVNPYPIHALLPKIGSGTARGVQFGCSK